jgi:sulfotransferase family protein
LAIAQTMATLLSAEPERHQILPVFVVGSPRSGTTLTGAYVGSAPETANFGELSVFYFSRWIARRQYLRVPTPLKDSYLSELEQHAIEFALRQTHAVRATTFCDSTPWNLRIVDYLMQVFPTAVFIVVLRHYSGVIQSLERSYRVGYRWAGPTFRQRAQLWSDMYSHLRRIPKTRIVPLGYDRLCADPNRVLHEFKTRLRIAGVPSENLSLSVFLRSHSTIQNRPTIGSEENGHIILKPVNSVDLNAWRSQSCLEVEQIVRDTDDFLRDVFPDDYADPINMSCK